MEIVYALGCHWVAVNQYGWHEIYREATRLCLVGYTGDKGFLLAVAYVAKLEGVDKTV